MKRDYIKRVLDDWDNLKVHGIFFSGVKGEGLYKKWHDNGQLQVHGFFKNNILDGEYKRWYRNGNLEMHRLLKDFKVIKDYLA